MNLILNRIGKLLPKRLNSTRELVVSMCTLTNSSNREEKTHFGFQTVRESEKEKKVYEVFENVANKYDLMNDAMSFGIHRIWKDEFMKELHPCLGTKLLDVAGGTGDIAFRYLKYLSNIKGVTSADLVASKSHVTIGDINPHMLAVGKKRAEDLKLDQSLITWKELNAEKLPFEDDTFSAYTIAFGIRNVTHIDKALSEAYRVLSPGGRFMCLEFSRVTNEFLNQMYNLYSFQVIPAMGYILAGQWQPYQYLVESIRKFPDQENFKTMIEQAGFRSVTYKNMNFGVVAIHSGFKL